MNLSLTNFRCWESKSFSFPSTGICLIHGRSGRGKSTILNAIYFAISGKLKNITTFGKKTTKVVLDIAPLHITRTRNPVSLIVVKEGVTYMDEGAQAIIDQTVGRQFACTSYIDQENSFSFAGMSPSDKIEFLESVIMEEFSIDGMRDRIRDDISSTKVKHAECEGKMASLRSVLAGMKKCNVPDLTIEKNKVTSANVDKILEKVSANLSVSERNSKVALNRIRKMEELCQKSQEMQEVRQKEQQLSTRVKELDAELQDVMEFADPSQIKELERKKEIVVRMQQVYQARERKLELESKIQHLSEELAEKRHEYMNQLSCIPKISDKEHDIMKDALKAITTLTDLDNKLDGFQRTDEAALITTETAEIDEIKSTLAALTQNIELLSKKLECPECQTALQMVGHTLIKMDIENDNLSDINTLIDRRDRMKTEMQTREKSLKLREKLFNERVAIEERYNQLFEMVEESLQPFGLELDEEVISTHLTTLTANKDQRKLLEDKINQLDNDRTLQNYRKDVELLATKCQVVEEVDEDLESIVQSLTVFSEKHGRYKTLRNKHSELSREHQRLLQQSDGSMLEEVDLEALKAEREKYADYDEKVKKYRQYMDQISEWKRMLTQREQYEKLETEIEELSDQRDELNDRMRGLVKLRDHIKVAEKHCMEEFIVSLNAHAAQYIDHFFEDEDLQVNLRSVQETKTGKEKIALNFDVVYRGLPGDLSFLSGGERDRVTLAFTLALSEMIHPTVLMLDECISSLDAETTAKVLDTLRESYKGKLVLLISHQANLGFFDSVLEI